MGGGVYLPSQQERTHYNFVLMEDIVKGSERATPNLTSLG